MTAKGERYNRRVKSEEPKPVQCKAPEKSARPNRNCEQLLTLHDRQLFNITHTCMNFREEINKCQEQIKAIQKETLGQQEVLREQQEALKQQQEVLRKQQEALKRQASWSREQEERMTEQQEQLDSQKASSPRPAPDRKDSNEPTFEEGGIEAVVES